MLISVIYNTSEDEFHYIQKAHTVFADRLVSTHSNTGSVIKGEEM